MLPQHEGDDGQEISPFGPWWKDPKKHATRVRHWLPHFRAITERLRGKRGLRYFTLCARHMIDVFMLLDEQLLAYDAKANAIEGVQFCEYDQNSYTEIGNILAREDSGFFGRLEEVALFADDDYTAQFSSRQEIMAHRESEGESLSAEQTDRLRLKETAFLFRESFPYDFVNLDFCDYYYKPPNVFEITKTVATFLDWQRNTNQAAIPTTVDDFVMAVTCRYDESFPKQAEAFLANLVSDNCKTYSEYKAEFRLSRGGSLDQWILESGEDLFLTAWPKHIAQEGNKLGWQSEVLDYIFYHRPPGSRGPYIMICLVIRFTRSDEPSDLATALHVLRRENRVLISDFDWDSDEGLPLRVSFERIRSLRNAQAKNRNLLELPEID